MTDADRIKLAKAMGWHQEPFESMDIKRWQHPNKSWQTNPPDPRTDANDCEALIRWLNEQGWIVNVNWSSEHSVKVWRFKNPDTKEFVWEGDDWKQGVCELALKVIDEKGQASVAEIRRLELKEGREHLTVTNEFQSDKYLWCPAGFVPLKLTDPMARDTLWDYARRRRVVDAEFSDDLEKALVYAGRDHKEQE